MQDAQGELKRVTVLFSDMSGYTAMSERLHPEEVAEIISPILTGVSQIITAHGGHVDKFIGDEVMAVFGRPTAREDDASEAIRTALEIHAFVDAIAPRLSLLIDTPVAMHSGVNTGVVISAEVDTKRGTELLGDTVNLAARLTSLACSGEIVVGENTHRVTEADFEFELLPPSALKGKQQSVQAYKVIRPRQRPTLVHRLTGLRAELVGRDRELEALQSAAARLSDGLSGAVLITGDAGTGKSRLVAEFKAGLGDHFGWLEGRSYPHSQGVPYFAFTDLLARAWEVSDSEAPDSVAAKIHDHMKSMDEAESLEPFVGALFGLEFPQLSGMEPSRRKSETERALASTLAYFARERPTLIHMEDLHWADRSSIELLATLLAETGTPALFLCAARPMPQVEAEIESSGRVDRMPLVELSPEQSREMLVSLLGGRDFPEELAPVLLSRTEGNPFYLEEVVNHLIERQVLVREADGWSLTRPITSADVPATIQGVISARVDSLPAEAKMVAQRASVIGRRFSRRVLGAIVDDDGLLESALDTLCQHDLIRQRSGESDADYTFKHAVTQEVVYEGVLRADRKMLHERVGCAIESLFPDRIPDLVESLAFHFQRGESTDKAISYLVRAGERALSQYALRESDGYFSDAFGLLGRAQRTAREDEILVDLVTRWAYLYFYRGDNAGLQKLMEEHLDLAASLEDRTGLGWLNSWLGFALWGRRRLKESYEPLREALSIGEQVDDPRLVGYATARLAWTCADLGLMQEAVGHAERSLEISETIESDRDLFAFARQAAGWVGFYTGRADLLVTTGEELLAFGAKHSHSRSMSVGYFNLGIWGIADGDNSAASGYFERAAAVSLDPVYSLYNQAGVGASYALEERFDDSERALTETLNESVAAGYEFIADYIRPFLGTALVAIGRMSEGMEMLEVGRQNQLSAGAVVQWGLATILMGSIYQELATGKERPMLSVILRNAGFLARNLPSAKRTAETQFRDAIRVLDQASATNYTAWGRLALGRLLAEEGRLKEAREVLLEAIALYDTCDIKTDRATTQTILDQVEASLSAK